MSRKTKQQSKRNKMARAIAMEANSQSALGLRVTDQESARVVAIHHIETNKIVGAGCIVSETTILTCKHVVFSALRKDGQPMVEEAPIGTTLAITLIGVSPQQKIAAVVVDVCKEPGYGGDIARLGILPNSKVGLHVPEMEFAAPLRHSGKTFFVLGFPEGSAQGQHASGTLYGADAFGLVQMDNQSNLIVRGGFSGAPIWSPEVGAFIGLVVSALKGEEVAWCIPSRVLCKFYPDLLVRFRIPPGDRPRIHDYAEDDPNLQLFGSIDDNGLRKLTANVQWDEDAEEYVVRLKYQCRSGFPQRGGYVTFITHPSFRHKKEDSYELFAKIEGRTARTEFFPNELFTVAAIGDGGDTALTLDLTTLHK